MKYIAILCFQILFLVSEATTYYVKLTGTGNGTQASPWGWSSYISNKNIINAGDIVLFNSGEVYPGPLPISNNNGTSDNSRITYGRYGTGNKPQFNGLATLSGWQPQGNIAGVYYVSLTVSRLQVVLFNGALTGPGRYPKNTYLTIGSHVDGQSVTSSSASSIPFNPAGGTLVVKKARYIIDRHPITSRSGNTIFITNDDTFGQTSNNGMTDGNGYFIQDNIGCLTQLGDWFYDKGSNRLYMYFGGSNPSSFTVQASTIDDMINASSRQFLTFDGLDFVGANLAVFNIQYSNNITIKNCSANYDTEGVQGLQGGGNVIIDGCSFYNSLSNGITTYESDRYTISNNDIRNSGLILGLSRSGDVTGNGIGVSGDYHNIFNNKVTKNGYCGIAFYASLTNINGVLTNVGGNGVKVDNNFVDSSCLNKDDGAGIYTFGSSPKTFIARYIRNNIVLHNIGTTEGVSPNLGDHAFATAIYLDNFSSNVTVESNFAAYSSGAGVFLNSVNNDTVRGNTFFDNTYSLLSLHLPNQVVNNLMVVDNEFISASADQRLFNFEIYTSNVLGSYGVFDNNVFYKPFGGQTQDYIVLDNRNSGGQVITNYTFQQWRSTYNKDLNSLNSTVTLPNNNYNDFNIIYNFSNTLKVTPLPYVYKNVQGNVIASGQYAVPAYSGDVLIYSGNIIVLPPGDPKLYKTPEGKLLKKSSNKLLKNL